MISHSVVIQRIIMIFALIALASCTKFPGSRRTDDTKKSQSPYTMPAEAYLALAKNQPENEQDNMRLMAAGRYIEDTQYQQAETILLQIKHLSALQLDEKNILLAKINVIHEQSQQAITHLSAVREVNQLPQYYQIEYYELLASAYESAGHLSYAVNERIKLDRFLSDEQGQVANRRKLWLDLTRLPSAELSTMELESDKHQTLLGWIKLALIARGPADRAAPLLERIEAWQQTYPGHPANSLLPLPLSPGELLLKHAPHEVALLLPFTGPLAGPGFAIRDGVMAAYTADGAPDSTHIRAYDTAAGDVRSLYEQALANGAELVIGPLPKPAVAAVAQMNHPVPTILLNESDRGSNDNGYSFGLFPVNEARQVAYKAHKKGLRRALVIAPSGTWGDDIAAAFDTEWRGLGGVVVERMTYDDNTDLNVGVRDFLHVSARAAKATQYHASAQSGHSMYSKRRQDFDMIFLLAYPSKARQIMPLLRYYFAGNIPVYATSAVYGGAENTIQDKDLDGIIFCDMVWVFNHALPSKSWPEALNSYTRLYAMGLDSYALASNLNRLILFPATMLNESGVLYLNRKHQIARILAWGQFQGGVAHMISETL